MEHLKFSNWQMVEKTKSSTSLLEKFRTRSYFSRCWHVAHCTWDLHLFIECGRLNEGVLVIQGFEKWRGCTWLASFSHFVHLFTEYFRTFLISFVRKERKKTLVWVRSDKIRKTDTLHFDTGENRKTETEKAKTTTHQTQIHSTGMPNISLIYCCYQLYFSVSISILPKKIMVPFLQVSPTLSNFCSSFDLNL